MARTAPKTDAPITEAPPASRERSVIVREMRDRLEQRRKLSATELVPAHVHEIYAQIWRGEELLRQERAKQERPWFRRLLARFRLG